MAASTPYSVPNQVAASAGPMPANARTAVVSEVARVLVVDDEPLVRLLLRLVLENEGHEVREASDGAAALVEIDRDTPDVVVTDLEMPNMSGADLVRRIRSEPDTANISIVVTSAGLPPDIQVDAVFAKPYIARDVAQAIDGILR